MKGYYVGYVGLPYDSESICKANTNPTDLPRLTQAPGASEKYVEIQFRIQTSGILYIYMLYFMYKKYSAFNETLLDFWTV